MILKIILVILLLTIIGCFYSQSQQIINLENRIESLESDIEECNKKLNTFDDIFIILINEIKKSNRFAT